MCRAVKSINLSCKSCQAISHLAPLMSSLEEKMIFLDISADVCTVTAIAKSSTVPGIDLLFVAFLNCLAKIVLSHLINSDVLVLCNALCNLGEQIPFLSMCIFICLSLICSDKHDKRKRQGDQKVRSNKGEMGEGDNFG